MWKQLGRIQSQGPSWLGGCLVLYAILAVISIVQGVIEAVERTFTVALNLAGAAAVGAVALYAGAWLLTLTVGPLVDWLRRQIELLSIRRKTDSNTIRSPFPKYDLLQDERYLDAVVWRLVDSYFGRKTVQLRGGLLSSNRRKRQRICELRDLRQQLLEDAEFFEEWRREGLCEVLEDPYNQATLTGIYNEVLKRVRNEAWGRRPRSELLEVVGFTIIRDAPSLPRWYFTRQAINFLSRKKSTRRNVALQRADSADAARMKVRSYLANGEQFREFLGQYFFEIMGELGPYEFYLPRVHEYYQREQKEERHYVAPGVRSLWRLLPSKSQTAEDAKGLADHRRHARELARQARERARRTKRLRRRYLSSARPGVIFSLFNEERTGLEEEIRDLLLELNDNDSREVEAALERLQRSRSEFVTFWKAHEADLLEAHHDRMTAGSVVSPAEKHERWSQRSLEQAMAVHRSEQELVRKEEYVAIDLEYGYLLAEARQRIRAKLLEPELDTLEHYLERELGSQLAIGPGARERFFDDSVRQALHDCERFRQGSLTYGQTVQALGYEPTMDRDHLAVAFVEHNQRWRQRYWEEAFPSAK